MKKAYIRNITLHVSTRSFDLQLPEKIISDARICECGSPKMMYTGGNDAKHKIRLSKSSPFEVKMLVEFIRRGISEGDNFSRRNYERSGRWCNRFYGA
jgi:hypothetical protein